MQKKVLATLHRIKVATFQGLVEKIGCSEEELWDMIGILVDEEKLCETSILSERVYSEGPDKAREMIDTINQAILDVLKDGRIYPFYALKYAINSRVKILDDGVLLLILKKMLSENVLSQIPAIKAEITPGRTSYPAYYCSVMSEYINDKTDKILHFLKKRLCATRKNIATEIGFTEHSTQQILLHLLFRGDVADIDLVDRKVYFIPGNRKLVEEYSASLSNLLDILGLPVYSKKKILIEAVQYVSPLNIGMTTEKLIALIMGAKEAGIRLELKDICTKFSMSEQKVRTLINQHMAPRRSVS